MDLQFRDEKYAVEILLQVAEQCQSDSSFPLTPRCLHANASNNNKTFSQSLNCKNRWIKEQRWTSKKMPQKQAAWPLITFAVLMQHIQRRDEELVGILLLVARQVACMCPHQVEQAVRGVWGPYTGVELVMEGSVYEHIFNK